VRAYEILTRRIRVDVVEDLAVPAQVRFHNFQFITEARSYLNLLERVDQRCSCHAPRSFINSHILKGPGSRNLKSSLTLVLPTNSQQMPLLNSLDTCPFLFNKSHYHRVLRYLPHIHRIRVNQLRVLLCRVQSLDKHTRYLCDQTSRLPNINVDVSGVVDK